MFRRLSAWYDAHRGAPAVIIGWLWTRALIIALLAKPERLVVGDVFYYHRKLAALSEVGLAQTLNEYPTPVVWILWLPYGATGGSRIGYLIAFIAFMLVLDAAFTRALWVSGGRRHDTAIDLWLLFVLLIGPLAYVRFDMIPAVLAGGALLAARHRPAVTGALIGLGAAVKLWPALLIPAFLAHKPDRKRAGLAFVVAGFGLALISLLTGGVDRLFSPLTWQSGRGLQIESVWATPLMVARSVMPERWSVTMSPFQAYEVFGPGVGPLLTISNVATVVGLAAIVVLWWRAYRTENVDAYAVGLIIMATVAIMTVTNKTLSPQYLLWWGGPMAAMLLLRLADPQRRAAVRRLAFQLIALALLTHLVFPLFYNGLLGRRGLVLGLIAVTVTSLRNVALVAFTVEVCLLAWRAAPIRKRTDTS